jgi:hypothetical protein
MLERIHTNNALVLGTSSLLKNQLAVILFCSSVNKIRFSFFSVIFFKLFVT